MRLTALFENKGAIGKWPDSSIVAEGASVPAPVEGWDAVSPLAAMSPKRAVQLDNWFPQPDWVELRNGHIEHSDTGSGVAVETLAKYQGVSSSFLFAASGTVIYDVTASGAGMSSHTGMANARFQHINFATTGGSFLWMCNGADDPIYFNGSAWSAAVITGVTASDIVNVNAHQNRIWVCLNNSLDAYYLATDSIQGAATKFALGGLFTQGGFLMAMGTWSVDAGDGPQDYAVFITSRGQCAIYSGTDPASNYALVGVFDLGAPLGRRCFVKAGSDLALNCIDGVIPLSKVMIFERAAIVKASLTQRIQRVMNASARSYRNNFGWQLISYPMGTRVILNVPVIEGYLQHQYVMNTQHGAWCRFTGMNANCWELLNDRLFFGGNDGIVYEADEGGADPNTAIEADMRTAFNYFGQRGRNKRWMMCRPLFTTDQSVTPGLAFNVDFQEDAEVVPTQSSLPVGSKWDESLWDTAVWSEEVVTQGIWTSVTGLGYCASIRVQAVVAASEEAGKVVLRLNGFDLTMQRGAFV